jgi:hypothetical protein
VIRNIPILLIGLLYSCVNKVEPSLATVLERAGGNKNELLKVLKYYSEKSDSLKLKAAYFLLENIDGMRTLDTNSVQPNEIYFNHLSTIDAPSSRMFAIGAKTIDSIAVTSKDPLAQLNVSYYNELENVSSQFLIRNIDSAFYVWQNMPWARNVSFSDFCEYILPYRCTNTYSDNIRSFFLNRYRFLPDSIKNSDDMYKVGKYIIDDVNSWFAESADFLPRYPFLAPIKFSNLLRGRIGACNDANSVRVAALRAMGIAAGFDQIPNWGNNNLPHFWYKIINTKNDTIKKRITNANVDLSTQDIISASSYDVSFLKGTPSYVQVNYNRTVPKVYRLSFSKQKGSIAQMAGHTTIPPYFRNSYLKDVTTDYLETTNVKVRLDKQSDSQKFAYLCVFDNERWQPVAWSSIKSQSASFRDMGKNIVYLPAYYKDDNMIPAGNPFLLTLNGKVETIVSNQEFESVKLFTKYPVRTYVLRWESSMVGGRFQIANKPDFSDSLTIHTIRALPFYEAQFNLRNAKPSRYIIYKFEGLKNAYCSEFQFYGLTKSGAEIKLSGSPIGNLGEYPHIREKLFDNLTYNAYKADMTLSEKYVGLDLGQGNSAVLTKVHYFPYTDDNAVKANETYELFYWNNEWKSLGSNIARKGKFVEFRNVPKGALLLLKNKNGGVQQRIFLFKNQQQIFW